MDRSQGGAMRDVGRGWPRWRSGVRLVAVVAVLIAFGGLVFDVGLGPEATVHASLLAATADTGAATPEPVAQSDGVVDVFWRGASEGLMHVWYVPGQGWSGLPSGLGGNLQFDPSPVSLGGGDLDVLYDGTDGNLWYSWYVPGAWLGPRNLGMGPLGGEPHAVSSQSGVVDVFWRGTDNGLWHAWYDGYWAGPQELAPAGSLTSDPVPVSTGDGNLDVFWEDQSGSLSDVTYRPTSGWSPAAGAPMGALGSLSSATAFGSGNQLVGWSGTDGNLWYATGGTGTLSGPSLAGGGPLDSSPRFASGQPGQVDAFWVGADGAAWYQFGSPGASWSGAQPLPSGLVGSQPMPVATTPGAFDVFWRGLDGGLWHAWGSNGGWAGPQQLVPPGYFGAAPGQCTAAQLTLATGPWEGAGGHGGFPLRFTNGSATGCTLTGYPGAAVLSSSGQQVVQASRTPAGYLGGLAANQSSPPVVDLGPGQTAAAMLEWIENPQAPQQTTCPTYGAVLVTPPDTSQSTELAAPSPIDLCANLEVHPVVSGTTGSEAGF
jgi:Protein of unknown function (DUF4232)